MYQCFNTHAQWSEMANGWLACADNIHQNYCTQNVRCQNINFILANYVIVTLSQGVYTTHKIRIPAAIYVVNQTDGSTVGDPLGWP